MRRTTRDWLIDIGLFLLAAGFSVIAFDTVTQGVGPTRVIADQITGALACAALFLRRRWPVHLAVALLVTGTFAHLVTGPTLIALFTVAAQRPVRTTAWVSALAFAPLPLFLARAPDMEDHRTGSAIAFFSLVAGVVGWGLFVRAQRQLAVFLRERAEQVAAEARRQVREDIAREMHDVLAHRLSLLSVHAGALEFNPGAPPAEIEGAARVIRDSAHQALEDLREVIGVLRAPEDQGRPQPTLADLDRLAEESRTAGMRVTLDQRVDAPAVPAIAGRTAYRIVQEGLTNARKHAPGTEAAVTVRGGPDEGLTVEVTNPAAIEPGIAVPGAGQGLIGLAERARLVGGRLEHGRDGAGFRLRAWLPWPARPDTAAPAVHERAGDR
ncbi:sensor histidine kinase [Actinomadura sp. 3N407]|uniref:sensor histidine kinase n=1 Tax=Actinomadura sp. 3N407 TaxID=3457423 RepID=UPI003FCC8FF2